MTRRLLLLVGGAALVLSAAGAGNARRAAAARSAWTIRNLGTLPAPYSRNSEADQINNRGQIRGWSGGAGVRMRGVVWRGGRRTILGGSSFVQTTAINARGDVIGSGSVTHDARNHLFLRRHDGTHLDLTSRYGLRGEVTDLNDRGEVVGQMQVVRSTMHAFLFDGRHVTDLGTLGGANSSAAAINNAGQVVGASETAAGNSHAFVWQRGKMSDLGTLRGESSAANSINARGDIVGYAYVGYNDADHVLLWRDGRMVTVTGLGPGGLFPREMTDHGAILVNTVNPARAYLWRAGKVTDLGSLGGGATFGYDVNEKGQVVGSSKVAPIHRAAFFWSRGKMTKLPALAPGGGPPYTTAFGINDRGYIVGASYVGRIGRERAVLWTFRR
jgi:probable HAF family extracellular repeat protein